MTTRLQILRSSITGNVPASGTRQPGELWLNFADFALGFIDASKNAQRITAVRYFQTTANYAIGDFVIQAGALYVANTAVTAGAFSAPQWTKIATASDITGVFVPLAGGVMTGLLTLSGPPTANLHAATKAYVDSGVSGAPFVPIAGGVTMTGLLTLSADPTSVNQAATKHYVDAAVTGTAPANVNRLDNGDMWVDQHNAGASVVSPLPSVWCPDRWQMAPSKAAKLTVGQNYNGLPKCPGFQYFYGVQTTTAVASPAAGDYFQFMQALEADAIGDFMFGAANAQPITLSFWACSSLTGAFSVLLTGANPARTYVTTYSLPTANTWTKIVLTVPGDTTGAWAMSGNGGGIAIIFDLGAGATYQTSTLNQWTNNANGSSATGAVRVVTVANAKWAITGVKLELGSVATPYPVEDLARKLARCQRYFQLIEQTATFGYNVAGAVIYGVVPLLTQMRANPTLTLSGILYSNASTLVSGGVFNQVCFLQANVTAAGAALVNAVAALSAEI